MPARSKAEIALDNWSKSLEDGPLQCRAGYRHNFPDWLDFKGTHVFKNRKTGVCRMEADCSRGCGTFKVQMLGADGVLEKAKLSHYDYDTAVYALPDEVRGALGDEFKYSHVIAACRQEILTRRAKRGQVTVVSDEDF